MEAQKNTETTDTNNTTIPAVPATTEVASTDVSVEKATESGTVATPAEITETPTPSDGVGTPSESHSPDSAVVTPADTLPVSVASAATVLPISKNTIKQYAVAVAVIAVIGLILWYGLERQGRVETGVFDKITALVSPEPAAAVVNGTVISLAEYDRNKQQLMVSAGTQGADTTDAAILADIEKQAIDTLVNTELLRQGAAKAGISVTKEEVDARYQEVLTAVGGAEVLATRMAEIGIDETGLRRDIEGELLIQAYLAEAVDTSAVEITEVDMRQVYDQAATTVPDLPPFEEVQAEIESQLRFTKEQELINAFIESLRTTAKVDVRI